MKITDAAHAVRVLEALVEQGDEMMGHISPGPWKADIEGSGPPDGQWRIIDAPEITVATVFQHGFFESKDFNPKFVAASRSLVPALVEGAKAVLKFGNQTETIIDGDEVNLLSNFQAQNFVIALAQAYAPRMAEAGMEVPE